MAEIAAVQTRPHPTEDFVSAKTIYRDLNVATTALKTAALAGRVRHTIVKTEITLYSRSDVLNWLKSDDRTCKNKAGRRPAKRAAGV